MMRRCLQQFGMWRESLWPGHVFTATGKWCMSVVATGKWCMSVVATGKWCMSVVATGKWCMSVAATLAGCWASCPQRICWRQRSMIARLVLTVGVVSCVA